MYFVYNVAVITLLFVISTTEEIKVALFILYTGTDCSYLYLLNILRIEETF